MKKLTLPYLILTTILVIANALFVVKITHALFSDTAISTQNTFQAAAVFPTTSPAPTPTPDLTNIANHIVISEVQINGGNANEDFVELYNPTNSPINLSGWKLRKKTSSGTETSLVVISSGKSIGGHGYFLWANNQSNFDVEIGADENNGNNLSENNSIALLTSADIVIDQIGWGNGSSQFLEGSIFPQSPATNQSLERKALTSSDSTTMAVGGTDELKGNGFDSGDNATDFVLRTASQPQNSASSTETP